MNDRSPDEEKFIKGRITDEDFDKMRALIGYANPTLGGDRPRPAHYSEVTSDSIRHYVNGYGDDNPLFCDRNYGQTTRWGSQIAPLMAIGAHSDVRFKPMSDDLRQMTKGVLRGVHLFASGSESYYYRPVVPGDRLRASDGVISIREKRSEFSGGRSAIVENGGTVINQNREVVSSSINWIVHTEREGSAKRAGKRHIELGAYGDDDLKRIDDAYENEFVRGGDTFYWEDASVGDEMPTMVKGPLRVTDIIAFHIGWGWGNYGIGALKLDYKNRKQMPGFYGKNEFGVWDVMQRLHWDPEFARAIGNPTTYDYAPVRFAWSCHYLTNFVGDDGWVYRMRVDLRKFNFVGDTTWFEGEIKEKRLDPELGPLIEVEVRGVNQRGEINCHADATLLLPSREHGAVALPPVPEDVANRAPHDDW